MGKVTAPNIVWKGAHPNNYAVGRVGGRNGQFTHHHVVGSADSAVVVFNNPNRGASSTFIVTDVPGLIYQCVSLDNTSYADGNLASNRRAITTEHHGDWRNGYWNETVINNSAWLQAWLIDNGYETHQVRHRDVSLIGTQCSADLPVEEIVARAKRMINEAYSGPVQPPAPVNAEITWEKLPAPKEYELVKAPTSLWNFNQTGWSGFGNPVKQFNQGDRVVIYGRAFNKNLNAWYYVTEYSYERQITNGFNGADIREYVAPVPVPTEPEWQRNSKPIEPLKLQVLIAQTPIINLGDMSELKQLGQGTWVDVVAITTVNGQEYYRSSYAVAQGQPNGIRKEALGVPAAPGNEKPAWLEKWEDIEDVTMYARADTDLVSLEDGSTITVIARGTPILVASTTEWYGHKYAITAYSTERKEARGIIIDDLDLKPIEDDTPIEPAPNQPDINVIDSRLTAIEAFINWLKGLLEKIGIKF